MRALIAAVSLLALASCNEVITQAPMFSKADAASAPPLRSGVWRVLPDSPCAFDAAKPVTSWPTCASGFLVIDGAFAVYEDKAGKQALTPVGDVLLADGAPMILQFGPGSSGVTGSGDKTYSYAGVRVTKRDAQGRIVGFSFWDVECGPPPPKGAKTPDGKSDRSGTEEPLAGLTMDKDGDNCSASTQKAIRDAAAASVKWATPDQLVWVRDGKS